MTQVAIERPPEPMDEISNGILNCEISSQEVVCAMRSMKNNKAYGIDELAAEGA